MSSYREQVKWNTSLSIFGQILTVLFITIISRWLGRTNFGFYIWITALPGVFVVFDLYLGIALQNRLTELYTKNEEEAADRLLWGFLWGMLAAALLFTMGGALATLLLLKSHMVWIAQLPAWVIWCGFVHVSLSAVNVSLLSAHLSYNAHREVQKNAIVSTLADVVAKLSFLALYLNTHSLAITIVGFSIVNVAAQVVTHLRFMRVYQVSFVAPSIRIVREAFEDLWHSGEGSDWAVTRVVDGVYKNAEPIIGTFIVGAGTIGDFAILDRLSNALMLAANSIYVPLVPQLASARASNQAVRMSSLSQKAIHFTILGLVLFSVFFLVAGEPLASWWAGRRIDFSVAVVLLLCVRSWTRVLSSLGFHLLTGHRLIRELKWATVITGFVYLSLYVVTVPHFGVLGMVVTQIIAQGLFIILAQRARVG